MASLQRLVRRPDIPIATSTSAFRRLEAKTQVFTTRFSDHFRNRLTHTLEVWQIARTVAGALGLNTELAEALALVHDIGHPPFGHAGERKLDELMKRHGGGFNHNLQALRIVDQFEQRYLDFAGLNLTFEVREGIIKHSRDYTVQELPGMTEYLLELRPPLEAQLIDCVDEIAYNTADLDDAREAELLDLGAVRAAVPIFDEAYAQVAGAHAGARERRSGEQRRIGISLIEIFADRQRLGQRAVRGLQRWHQALRVEREIIWRALFAAAEVVRHLGVREAL